MFRGYLRDNILWRRRSNTLAFHYLICVLQAALAEGTGRGIPDYVVVGTCRHTVRVVTASCSALGE